MKKYIGKKVAILNASAVAYSGVSTCIEDIKKWEAKNKDDITIDVFHYEFKKQKVKSLKGFEYDYEEIDMNDIESFVENINSNYDVVILMTEAKITKTKPASFFRAFYFDIWKKINVVKIRMQHDATRNAISRAPFNMNISNEADAILTISKTSEYINDIRNNLPSKEDRIFKYDLWLDFDMFDKWKEEDIEKDLKMTYLGRYSSVKNPDRILSIAKELQNLGLTIEMYGMDTSIATVKNILDKECVRDYVRNRNLEEGFVNVYPKYERLDGLNKMKKSLFGYSFFSYSFERDKGFYGNRLEYAQQEIIACGAIPIFDFDWGINCRAKDGRRYIDIPNFAIFYKKDKDSEFIDDVKKVLNDKELQKKYVETSYRILKENYDMNVILEDYFNMVCSIDKDKDKFKDEYDLAYHITKDMETAKAYTNMINDETNLSSTNFEKLKKKEIHVFGGKSGKASVKIN